MFAIRTQVGERTLHYPNAYEQQPVEVTYHNYYDALKQLNVLQHWYQQPLTVHVDLDKAIYYNNLNKRLKKEWKNHVH